MPSALTVARDYSNPRSLGNRFRQKRFSMFFDFLRGARAEFGRELRIVDIGGTATGWTPVDLDAWERELGTRISIQLLNIEESKVPVSGRFSHAKADCSAPVEGVRGDVVFSNSVIEHLGGTWPALNGFADNCRSLGRYYFVQTPSFWFPMEPHFLRPFVHYLPRELKVKLLMKVRNYSIETAFARSNEIFLLDPFYLRRLFPEAQLHRERLALLTKSYVMTNFPGGR